MLRRTPGAHPPSGADPAHPHRAGIEDLREKREEVNRSIAKDEEEKGAPRPRTHHPCVASGAAGGGRGAHPCGAPRAPTLAAKIQNDLRILTERLARLNDNLARKITSRNEYDKTIQETEAAYMKILESSQTLLHVLKRETVNLTKKKQYSS